MQEASERDISLLEARDFEPFTGKGVTGVIEGKNAAIGNHKLFDGTGVVVDSLAEDCEALRRDGQSVMYLVAAIRR